MPSKLTSAVSAAVDRMAVPVFVFGMVFAAAMGGMTYLASPDRFPVRVGDKVIRVQDLADEEKSLKVREQALIQTRKELDEQVPTPVLRQVGALRGQNADVGRALKTVQDVRKSFALVNDSPVLVQRVWYDRAENRLAIAGEVRDPAGRSMQILASFVDSLRASRAFANVSEPEYTQSQASDGSVVSPYSGSLSLTHGG